MKILFIYPEFPDTFLELQTRTEICKKKSCFSAIRTDYNRFNVAGKMGTPPY